MWGVVGGEERAAKLGRAGGRNFRVLAVEDFYGSSLCFWQGRYEVDVGQKSCQSLDFFLFPFFLNENWWGERGAG